MRRMIIGCVVVLSAVAEIACGSSSGTTGSGGSTGTTATTGTSTTGSTTTTGATGTGGSGGGTGGSGSGTGGSGTGGSGTGGSMGLGPAPHTIVYAGTITGIDVRRTTDDAFTGLALSQYTASAEEHPEIGSNQAKDVGGDAFAVVGRWAGGTTAGKFYSAGNMGLIDLPADGGFHYAIGEASDPIPSSGAAAYSLKTKTTVTVSDGSVSPGTLTGSVAANLAGGATKIGFSLSLDVPGDATYTLASKGGAADPSMSESMIVASVKGAFISNFTVTSPGAACKGGASCNGAVYGFVSGPNAERIALVAHVYSGAGGSPKSVSAAAVFTR